jgi:hypothetical protein
MTLPVMSYNAAECILWLDNSGVDLETRDDIVAYFEGVLHFWRGTCGGNKVFVVTGYDGFSINLRESDWFLERLKPAVEVMALAVLRYGGDPLQRTAARVRSMKLHSNSSIYDTREEALAAVRKLRAERAAAPTK